MGSRQNPEIITFEKGSELIDAYVTKLKRILEGKPEPAFVSHEYIGNYTTVYNMCIQKPPNDCSERLYEKYGDIFIDYDTHTVSIDPLFFNLLSYK